MGCGKRSWKREEKLNHTFDFLDLREFHTNGFKCRFLYLMMWFNVFRSVIILGLDIYTAIGLLVLNTTTSAVQQQNFIAHGITKWIFGGCIILSVLLLIWDWSFAIPIIRKRNISYCFTNLIANRWFSMKGYNYHCLFYKLENTNQNSDALAFWVFFSFIGWKRTVAADGPRQVINALTLFSVLSTRDFSLKASAYDNITPLQWTVLAFMALSLFLWFFTFIRFSLSVILYPFLLCHLGGSLSEFVCKKIDKRIAKLIEKARKKRVDKYAKERAKEAERDAGLGKSQKKNHTAKNSVCLDKPTLPQIPGSDEEKLLQPSVYEMSDNNSLHSHNGMHKSESYNSMDSAGPELAQLPLYQDRHNRPPRQSFEERENPTLPSFGDVDLDGDESVYSLPRAQSPSVHETLDRQPRPRPTMQPTLPSYHRQESYEDPYRARENTRRPTRGMQGYAPVMTDSRQARTINASTHSGRPVPNSRAGMQDLPRSRLPVTRALTAEALAEQAMLPDTSRQEAYNLQSIPLSRPPRQTLAENGHSRSVRPIQGRQMPPRRPIQDQLRSRPHDYSSPYPSNDRYPGQGPY